MKRTLLVLFAAAVASMGGTAPVVSTTGPTSHAVSTAPPSVAQETGAEYPPGLSAAGVTDPLALVDAHRNALSNASYTLTVTTTYRRPNGSLVAQTTSTARVASGGSSYAVVASQTRPNDTAPLGVGSYRVSVWANETDAVIARHDGAGDPTYRQSARERAPYEPSTQWQLFYSAFGATNTSVVDRVERDGTTLFRVVSTGSPGMQSASPNHGRYGFVAEVDSQGVVRTFQQSYRTTFDDRPAVVSRTVRVAQVGNTTVERPGWYEQAAANATDESAG